MGTQATEQLAKTAPDRNHSLVSLIIPAYNESRRIEHAIREAHAYFTEIGQPFEVLVMDDGSTDATVQIATEIASSFDGVTVMAEPHRGKAGSVLAGMNAAKGEIVGFTDVDLATPLETWIACRDAIQNGAGVAIASREGPGSVRIGEPHYRHAMGRVFNGMVRALLLPGIHDTQCGFKFFSRSALDVILPRVRLYGEDDIVTRPRVTAFDVELLYIARLHGFWIAEVPIRWTYGDHTKVHPITDTLQNGRDVLQVRVNGWRKRYS